MFRRFSVLLALSVATAAIPQTHDQDGFRLALPGYRYQFPRDHGAHFDYRLEWWYYTGNLTCESGRPFGFEVTFFRVGVEPMLVSPSPSLPVSPSTSTWDLRHLAPAHFALTDISRREFRYHEKLNRFVPYIADAATDRLHVFNENWRVEALPDGRIALQASADGDAVNLVMTSAKKPVTHGTNGVSVKAAGVGYASHYYSLTRLEVQGEVRSRNRPERCRGLAWMDHEFSSSALRETQAGWDWFSIQLDDNFEVMLYQMRTNEGRPDEHSSGTFIAPDGGTTHLTAADFQVRTQRQWTSTKTKATYPMGWEIAIPRLQIVLLLEERLEDQELVTRESTQVTYWEGAVTIKGTRAGQPVRGAGYVEMSGYERALSLP